MTNSITFGVDCATNRFEGLFVLVMQRLRVQFCCTWSRKLKFLYLQCLSTVPVRPKWVLAVEICRCWHFTHVCVCVYASLCHLCCLPFFFFTLQAIFTLEMWLRSDIKADFSTHVKISCKACNTHLLTSMLFCHLIYVEELKCNNLRANANWAFPWKSTVLNILIKCTNWLTDVSFVF